VSQPRIALRTDKTVVHPTKVAYIGLNGVPISDGAAGILNLVSLRIMETVCELDDVYYELMISRAVPDGMVYIFDTATWGDPPPLIEFLIKQERARWS
jgi:hypothetical protein